MTNYIFYLSKSFSTGVSLNYQKGDNNFKLKLNIMDWIFIIIAVIIELIWVIGIITCIKGDYMDWEDWSKYIIIIGIANIVSVIIWFKYF